MLDRPNQTSPAPMSSFFDEVTSYIGFGPEDSKRLAEFLPVAAPHFDRISEHFYAQILAHPHAHRAITGGSEQVARLKQTLVEWMRSGLAGPHNEVYCSRRARIGHIHVRIGLPQRFMVTAMNVMRLDFRELAKQEFEGTSDELEQLHASLERLFDLDLAIMLETYKPETAERLRRRERLATIGQLAASIGHDLRNPLSVMESSLYILRRRMSDDARANRHIEKIAHQIDECDAIITHLLEMARNQPPRRDRTSASVLLDEAIDAADIPNRFTVECTGFTDLELWVDSALLKQSLINLLINAVQAQRETPAEPAIEVSATSEGSAVILEVRDAGPGFNPDTLATIFEPLVTTKATGTGLGLALVKSVIERHGGHVTASNRPEGGAVVELYLPDALPPEASP